MTSSTPSNSAVPMAHHGYPRSQLEGSSPLARSQQHQAAVADWLYQFEFTSPRLLQQLMGIQYTGWPATKTARALLKKVQLAPQVPRHVYTLTPHGRQLAETRTTQLIPGRVEQEARLAPALVRHELICQWLTLQHIQRGIVSSFMTASALLAAHPDVKDAKVPDVLWTRPDGNVIALEVELTAKWGRRLDDFVLRLARLLHRRELMDHRVDGVLIAVPSRTMAEHYRQAVAPGSPLRQWAKNTRNHWHVEKTSALRAEIASQFEVLVFPSPEY